MWSKKKLGSDLRTKIFQMKLFENMLFTHSPDVPVFWPLKKFGPWPSII